jgi:hypothetical protein
VFSSPPAGFTQRSQELSHGYQTIFLEVTNEVLAWPSTSALETLVV